MAAGSNTPPRSGNDFFSQDLDLSNETDRRIYAGRLKADSDQREWNERVRAIKEAEEARQQGPDANKRGRADSSTQKDLTEREREASAANPKGRNARMAELDERMAELSEKRAKLDQQFQKSKENLEKANEEARQQNRSLYRGRHRQPESEQKGRWDPRRWFRKGKHRKKIRRAAMIGGVGIGSTALFMIIVALFLLIVAPYKNVHMADILRSVGFARFTYQMNKQWSRVIFDAATLTDRSTGTFPERSLVSRVIDANPVDQLDRLRGTGADSKVKWDFQEEGARWRGAIRGESTYRGVTVDGRRIDLNNQSRELYPRTIDQLRADPSLTARDVSQINRLSRERYGMNYDELPERGRKVVMDLARARGQVRIANLMGRTFNELNRSQRAVVTSRHVSAYRAAIGEAFSTLPRSQYWQAYRRFHQATGVRLYAWPNQAREWRGVTMERGRTLWQQQVVERIRGVLGFRGSRLDIIDEDARLFNEQVNQAVEQGRPPPGEIRNQVAQRLRVVGNVSMIVLLATISCTVHALHNDLQDAEKEREELASRMGNLTLSTRDQTLAGATEEVAVGVVNEEWDGAEQSVFYRQSIGRPLTREDAEQLVDVPAVALQMRFASLIEAADNILFGGPADSVPGVVPAKEAACNVLMKDAVQWTIAGAEVVVSIATAGALRGAGAAVRAGFESAALLAAGMGLGQLLGSLTDSYIRAAAGTDFSGVSTGAEKYNENHVAMNYISQPGNRLINFGRLLSQQAADAAQRLAVEDLHEQNRNAPFSERYFALNNPFSVTSRLVAITPSTATGIANNARSGVASLGSIISSPVRIFGSVLDAFTSNNIARAEVVPAPGTNLGVDQWGWSVDEQRRVDTDPSFLFPEDSCGVNPNNFVCIVESRIEELNARYWDCYDPEVFIFQSDRPEKCNEELLSAGHPDYGDDALYWRYYMAYLYALGRINEGL